MLCGEGSIQCSGVAIKFNIKCMNLRMDYTVLGCLISPDDV